MQRIGFESLDEAGLNLQAVFKLSSLADTMYQNLADLNDNIKSFSCLLLVAHAGKQFWQKFNERKAELNGAQISSDPIDQFSKFKVEEFLQQQPLIERYHFIYPGPNALNLQAFGRLAGWHFDSPLRIGINDKWGTWFAYRAAVLVKGELKCSRQQHSPACPTCDTHVCLSACPAKALSLTEYNIQACIDFRLSENSPCQNQCLARLACPVAKQHQYSKQQVNYHYERSFRTISSLSS